MLDAAREAIDLAEGPKRSAIHADRTLALSLVRLLEIVGEAVNHVSPQTRAALPEVAWQKAIAMRHRLIHPYFDIDLDIVWETVKQDLPPLVEALEEALDEDDGPEAPT